MTWFGLKVFSGAMGIPMSLHVVINTSKLFWRAMSDWLTSRKSSRTCTPCLMCSLILAVHCSAVLTVSSRWQLAPQPLGKHLSEKNWSCQWKPKRWYWCGRNGTNLNASAISAFARKLLFLTPSCVWQRHLLTSMKHGIYPLEYRPGLKRYEYKIWKMVN